MTYKIKHSRFIVFFWGMILLATTQTAVAQVNNSCNSDIDVYISSRAGDRIAATKSTWFSSNRISSLPLINVNGGIRYQKIEGFGASFNEAGMLCLNALTPLEKKRVIKSLFDSVGGQGLR